ncbi:hypothetical protein BS78_01G162300 [Paspalum vaginatum]|nr:hypothetical protein BS78_01G162300 [Paspalum vaginatum]
MNGDDGSGVGAVIFPGFLGDGVVSPLVLLRCVRGKIIGTSDVFFFRAAGVVGGLRLFLRSPALWAVAADLSFLSHLRAEDGRCSFKACDSLCRVGWVMFLRHMAHPTFGASTRLGRWICSESGGRRRRRSGDVLCPGWIDELLCIFPFFQSALCKEPGVCL